MPWTVYNSDGKVLQSAEVGNNSITNAKMADDAIDSAELVAGSVDIAHLSASGSASSSTFLAGNNSWVAAGGDLSFGGDTFGADKVIGSNDAYSLSFETAGVVRMKIHGPVTSPTSAGSITMPTQPTMAAYGTSGQSNVTGNATVYILLLTEIWDVGGNFASNTFTAPVTGKYQASAQVELECAGATQTTCYISTSNRDWHTYSGGTYFAFKSIATVDMDAGDTLTCKIQATGVGSDASDINTGSSASMRSRLSVWLAG
jgi:hypothetical protein